VLEVTPARLSRAFGIGGPKPKFSWSHLIEYTANAIIICSNISKSYRISSVRVAGIEAKPLLRDDSDRYSFGAQDDWYLFHPPPGNAIVEVEIASLDDGNVTANCQSVSETWSGVGFLKITKVGEPDPPGMVEVERDWQNLSFKERRLKGVSEAPVLTLSRPAILNTSEIVGLKAPTSISVRIQVEALTIRRHPLKEIRKIIEILRIHSVARAVNAWRSQTPIIKEEEHED